MDSSMAGNSYQGGAPEPARTMSLDQDTQTYTTPMADDLQYSPPPADPALASQLEEAKGNYGRALNALNERNTLLDDMRRQVAEVQLELEALRAAQSGRVDPNSLALPSDVDPHATATLQDLFQFGKNVAQIVEQRMSEATAQQIRSNWGVTPAEEQTVLQRFPSYQNLPEPQRSQQIKRAVELLIRSSQPAQPAAAPASNSSPPAPAPVTQRIVPHVERGYAPVDETTRGNAMTEALAVYNAIKTDPKMSPQQRATALRAAAEKIQALTGSSFEDTMKGSWTSRG